MELCTTPVFGPTLQLHYLCSLELQNITKLLLFLLVGADILTLSKEELVQICGLSEGIRLNNTLQIKQVRPRLTIYVNIQSESGT